ncbi:unnamed protein product [Periconia digitata]|uniref:Uncharacterized protein n=1 Tax=Periconia digitata TaxID=1303443 RepID=A0A9W4UCK6_9PLEO|nr:unnamed protein product [Periconia digitata]
MILGVSHVLPIYPYIFMCSHIQSIRINKSYDILSTIADKAHPSTSKNACSS